MLKVRNINFIVASIFLYVGISNFVFFNFLVLNIILAILLAFLLLSTILLLSTLNIFKINNLNNLVIFNIKVNNATILLKSYIKYW